MNKNVFLIVLVSLMAALVAVGAIYSIPMPPPLPPVTLAVFFTLLSGLLLGPIWGGAALLLYLLVGSLGLPVFANGGSGFGYFGGPTGGFLLGYLAAALLAGLLADRKKWGFLRALLAALAGVAILYIVGLPWFRAGYSVKKGIDLSLAKAFMIMLPYLLGDIAKAVAAAALVKAIKPLLVNYPTLTKNDTTKGTAA